MVIVEASLKHSNSINRTNLDCMENEQPAACMNLMICFTYRGREVPGYIGKLLEEKASICIHFRCTCLQNNATGI